MTIVYGVGRSPLPPSHTRRKSAEFTLAPEVSGSEPVPINAPGPTGVLGLQETASIEAVSDTAIADDGAARVYSEQLLKVLDDLQLSLLRADSLGPMQTRLKSNLQHQPAPRSPIMRAVVDAIRLRAAVEAARAEKC